MDFALRLKDVRSALLGLATFAAVGILLGLGIGFLRFDPSVPGGVDLVLGLLGGYLFTALPEELLFRGLIQNLLTRRIGKAAIGLVIASIVFGLSHLNNSTPRFAEPNWAYALMATLAGLAYGWVWLRSQKVTASALTHALVNAVWGVFFR
jgi:membrane protease YdiL (CAAX protease family)